MDGSQKLPRRLLGTIRDRLAAGRPIVRLALAVAAWMRYVTGIDENGLRIDVSDPLAEQLWEMAATAGRDRETLVGRLFGKREIFGDDLPKNEILVSSVTGHVISLFEHGALQTVASVNMRTD